MAGSVTEPDRAETPPPPPEAGRVRVRLDLAYDGTGFSGWARQPGLRTVQGVLEEALGTVLRGPVDLTVAGRTDAGVHARGQVAHADVDAAAWAALPGRGDHPSAEALRRRLSGVLSRGGRPRGASDVVVRRAAPAPPGFDARFSALRRRYAYRICDDPAARDPLRRHDVLWHPKALDADAMDAAGALLLGEYDFAAYCTPRAGATTIRELQVLRWRREPAGGLDAGLLVADVRADAFCHSMVRALVGACVAAGEGRFAPDRAVGIRDEAQRTSEFIVVPARGLTLVEVGYPPDAELASRAEQTRAKRVTGTGLPDEGPID